MQIELTQQGPLLNQDGSLAQIGWARQPILECNLESARFYGIRAFQGLRIKRWDYYAVFSPRRFFSATIADLGYAGNIFVYTMDLESGDLNEKGLVIPFSKGIELPRDSTEGNSHFENANVMLDFQVRGEKRNISVRWAGFDGEKNLTAEIELTCLRAAESMNIVIPIGKKRFYYNRKINCMPVSGAIQYGRVEDKLDPKTCIGSLDWGRGVWEYESFWNWASTSGFLPDGRTVGLNMGCGFGDLSKAGENALILDNHIHKLEQIQFDYISGDYMKPWKFSDSAGRVNLVFTPFKDRTARTNLAIIKSEVHQMFGKYNGEVVSDQGEIVKIKDLIGFAEEHKARW